MQLGRTFGIAAALIAVAGCGASAAPGSGGAPSSSSPAGASSSAAASSTTVVKVGTATVGGSSEQVLTNSSGMTLYYLTSDTATTSQCSGACAGIWPALTLSSGQPAASGSLPDMLTAITDSNGRQVQYDGHFLYTFSNDSAQGQANGNGIKADGGTWWVATPSLSASGGSSGSSSSSGYPGGY